MPVPKGFKEIRRLMKKGQAKRSCALKSYGLTPEKKGVRVLTCCPRTSFDPKTGRCKASTKGVAVFKRKK